MSHDSSHHHDHGAEGVSDRGLLWAVALNLGLTGFEIAAGVVAGSVSLIADALHNFNDCAALFIAYLARRIARREANERFTFTYRRAELIGAMVNLTALLVVGLFLTYEAVRRMFEPQPLNGGWMMGAAAVALVVDIGTAWLLWAMSKGNMNVRAAFVHNVSDALASVAVLAGGAAVKYLGWTWIDPVLTLAIAAYIFYLSVGMLRRTSHILMEGAPEDLDLRELQRSVQEIEGVDGLHHLHVWELDEEHRAMEAHVVVAAGALERIDEIKRRVKDQLAERFGIGHSTLEFERAETPCVDGNELIHRHE